MSGAHSLQNDEDVGIGDFVYTLSEKNIYFLRRNI